MCLPIFESYVEVVTCLEALVAHTPDRFPILVIDDGSTDPRIQAIAMSTTHPIVFLHRPTRIGMVASVNDAFDMVSRSDVVVLGSDVIVGPEWLDRLREAAHSSGGIATATPITRHCSFVSVPSFDASSPASLSEDAFDQAASRVSRASQRLRPLIPSAIGRCIFYRRSALDVVGYLDETFSPGNGAEIDFSQRSLALGLVNICADDVFINHRRGTDVSDPDVSATVVSRNEQLIADRYPYYDDWVNETVQDTDSLLAAALTVAGAAVDGLRVIVDGFCLGPTTMGTQVLVNETARALARHPAIAKVTIFVPESIAAGTLEDLRRSSVDVVVTSGPEYSHDRCPDAHVVYRPYQVNRIVELEWLVAAAPRLVVTQLDCIAYNNPGYFVDSATWSEYKHVIRLSFESSSGHTFLSNAAVEEARRSGLVKGEGEYAVAYPGSDNEAPSMVPVAPAGLPEDLNGFLLCLGAAFLHKNRMMTIRILEEAGALGWDGELVLAGPTPPDGNSLALEDAFLLAHPKLAARVWRVDAVSNEEREWLYERAALVLYPTLAEGFGMIPFEAAMHNVPCLSTRSGGLDEILPHGIPTIDPARLEDAARMTVSLVNDRTRSRALCDALGERAADFTWDGTASSLVDFFLQVLGTPQDRFYSASEGAGREAADPSPEERLGHSHPIYSPLILGIRSMSRHPRLKRIVAPTDSRRTRLGRRMLRLLEARSSQRRNGR